MNDKFLDKLRPLLVLLGVLVVAGLLSGALDMRQGISIRSEGGSAFFLYVVALIALYLFLRLIYWFIGYVQRQR